MSRTAKPFDPIKHYRHDLKRQVMITVWVIVAAVIVLNTVSTSILAAGMFFKPEFWNEIIGMFAQDDLTDLAMDPTAGYEDIVQVTTTDGNLIGLASIASVLCTLPLFLILRGKKLFTSDITETRNKCKASLMLQIFIIAMGAQLIFGMLTTGLNKLLEPLGMDSTQFYESSLELLKSPVGLIYIMLIGPVCEEIIFRGAVMRSFERFGGNFAIVMSSLFFALYHIITVQVIFAFFMGLILGYIAHRYSLLWAIIVHMLINSVATLTELLLPVSGASILNICFFAVGLILFIIFIIRGVIKEQLIRGKPLAVVLQDGAPPMIATPDIASLMVNNDIPSGGSGGSIPADTVKTYKPKVYLLAFSTVSFLLYVIVILAVGILLMFNLTALI